MYTMLPFHHMSRTFNDLFDEMERSMFPAQPSGRLPAFRTQLRPLLRRERHPGGGHLRRL